jgi:5-methyltetrahydrofolate--homocysteine methyltransferase
MRRNEFKNLLEQKVLFLDGSYGSEFIKRGLGEKLVERLNLTASDEVRKLQKEYVEVGVDIILTNTFSANRAKLGAYNLEDEIEKINAAAVRIARSVCTGDQFVFGNLGPTGFLLEPFGPLSFRQAYDIFKEQASILVKNGVDGLIIETMSDLKELKAAILAVREVTEDLPLIAQMTFGADGLSLTGTSVEIFASLMNDLEVDVVGLNCSLDPEKMLPVLAELAKHCSKPLSVEPNAGQPQLSGNKLNYLTSPEELAVYARDYLELGANIIGGCCGTGPEHIRAMVKFVGQKKPMPRKITRALYLSSRTILKPVEPFLVVGERINASAKKKLLAQIQHYDFSEIISLAQKQQDEGAAVIDVNPGIEKLLAAEHIRALIQTLDRQSTLPLSVDIQDDEFLRVALEEYAGRPLLNSANVRQEHLLTRLNLIKRHGGLLIVLAIEDEVPPSAEERIKVLEKAIKIIQEQGVELSRIFFDPLVLPHGAGHDFRETIKTIHFLREKGLNSIIGLSNLSYGLPEREKINAAFLSLCLSAGLKAAILNTSELTTMNVLEGGLALQGLELKELKKTSAQSEEPVVNLLIRGKKDELKALVEEKLKELTPLSVSQNLLGRAMEKIGQLYASGEIFLPHLILSAETARPIFDYLNSLIPEKATRRGRILLATVEGDIHDIGKNIVATIFRSSGFEVMDLGKNVPAETVVLEAKKLKPDVIGLSAMMTTTVGRVKETADLIKSENLNLPILAGGASMNQELAERFEVYYAKDALQALEICHQLIKSKRSRGNESHRKD